MRAGITTRGTQWGVAATLLIVAVGFQADAIVNKIIDKVGLTGPDGKPLSFRIDQLVTTLLAPAEKAGEGGKPAKDSIGSDVQTFILAAAALFFLSMIGGMFYAIGRIGLGSRGGGESLIKLFFALLAALAVYSILA
jgi:hypothetical protein